MKPLYLNTLIQMFNYFKTIDGESITGITNAIANARQGKILSLDPYIIDNIL